MAFFYFLAGFQMNIIGEISQPECELRQIEKCEIGKQKSLVKQSRGEIFLKKKSMVGTLKKLRRGI